jgi:hypothetical protein
MSFWRSTKFEMPSRLPLRLLAVGLVAAGGAELAARAIGFGDPPLVIRDEKIEYYLAPSRSYRRFGHDIRVNRYSMRSDDVDVMAVDHRFAFSLLGDSVVYGNRLDQADTISSALQRLIRAKQGDPRALVNSISASSWGPENLLEFYGRFGPFRGNVAWIIQSTHDMADVTNLPGHGVPYRTYAPYCALHDLVISIWQRVPSFVPNNKVGSIPYDVVRRRADTALDALITALKLDYTRVILVFHATREEAVGGKAEGLAHYRTVAEKHGVNFISTVELYARAYGTGRLPHYDEIHLSKDGARILSERLAADIGAVNPRD